MDIIISNSSGKPIYEQIADQVKEQIMAGALAAALAFHSSGDKLYAEVWQDDRLVERVELTDTTDRTIDLDGHNVIVLSGKTAVMQSADCPDQVCVDQGWISDGTVPVVCLPNRLVIQIEGGGDGLDSATG